MLTVNLIPTPKRGLSEKVFLTRDYANLTRINADLPMRYLLPSALHLRESAFKKVFFRELLKSHCCLIFKQN